MIPLQDIGTPSANTARILALVLPRRPIKLVKQERNDKFKPWKKITTNSQYGEEIKPNKTPKALQKHRHKGNEDGSPGEIRTRVGGFFLLVFAQIP